MSRRIRLTRVRLSYGDGMVLHTASSGAVPFLDELRLIAEQDGAIAGLGATRLNIEYLSGIPPEALLGECLTAADAIDWNGDWRDLPARLPAALSAPARMLFEMAAADGAARVAGLPLAAWLGGVAAGSTPTNQTLFLCDDATLLRRARAYAARGFLDLKLRVGAGAPADDLRRVTLLRQTLGAHLSLSADANGSWSAAEAPAILRDLAAAGLRYVEQPIAAGDWQVIARVAQAAPIPVMLDESLCDAAAIETLCRTRAAPLAHLKLAKLGGLDRLMRAGRALLASGIGLMVGQMNEGAVSTLAIAHAAIALEAQYRELYGADGLVDDPAGALRYAEGQLWLPAGPGLGLATHDFSAPVLREYAA